MRGNICIGCISDTDPQPIMVRSKLGLYAVCSIGIIQNAKALSEELLENGCANFETMSSGNINSGGLIGALIAQKPTFVEGIRYAQSKIEGTMSLVIMTEDSIICARDKAGKLPILIGKRSDGYCFSFESFAYQKLGYETCHDDERGVASVTEDVTIPKGNTTAEVTIHPTVPKGKFHGLAYMFLEVSGLKYARFAESPQNVDLADGSTVFYQTVTALQDMSEVGRITGVENPPDTWAYPASIADCASVPEGTYLPGQVIPIRLSLPIAVGFTFNGIVDDTEYT